MDLQLTPTHAELRNNLLLTWYQLDEDGFHDLTSSIDDANPNNLPPLISRDHGKFHLKHVYLSSLI